jgi:hypothetical protein
MEEHKVVIKELTGNNEVYSIYELLTLSLMETIKYFIEEYTDLKLGDDVEVVPVYNNPLLTKMTKTTIVIDVGTINNISPAFPNVGHSERYFKGLHIFMFGGTALIHVISQNEIFAHRLATALMSLLLVHRPFFKQFGFNELKVDGMSATVVIPDESGAIGSSNYDVMLNLSFSYEHQLTLIKDDPVLNKIHLAIETEPESTTIEEDIQKE